MKNNAISKQKIIKISHQILSFFGIKKLARWVLPHASCVYLTNNDGQVLAVSRKNDSTKWGLPGGKKELLETDEQAAVRELYEETGLDVNVCHLRKIFEDIDDFEYWTTCYYVCLIFNCDIKKQIAGEGQVKWVDRDVLTSGIFGGYNTKAFKAIDERLKECCYVCGAYCLWNEPEQIE